MSDVERRKRRTLLLLMGLAVGMFGFGFAMVPLYGLLCKVTGVQSVGQRATIGAGAARAAATGVVQDRWVTVKFDTTIHPNLPWRLEPMKRRLRVRPGEHYLVKFIAENRSGQEITGQAIPSIAPWQATGFFAKMECFCFNRQTLAGNAITEMPLRFSVSPDLPADINSLTLSYSVLRVSD
ncbi:cytochrome c oxidase assembly protein [Candidatus Thiosymbion oneisti]|uniref:cytochrome c oxidase assembly protein n=1 Tax=Candidatus Thiosymbion oneisti TaxID=589554 RepID=UPI000AF6D540|nr:cytochrome c oxidase assembly protein [Candidatus Thiosymbion oneisti]